MLNKNSGNKKKLVNKSTFQFRHLNYLNLPDSIRLVLHRRVNLIAILSFMLCIILESFLHNDLYTFLDSLL
jgi:hypothetical protein